MASYDYKKGKKRLEEILDNRLEIIESNKLPADDNFTFNNGYLSWITSIFVDIRDSSTLFSDEDKEKVSKIIRCFTSEIIEILRDDDGLREIGIRGDCVYSIYTTPKQTNIYEIYNKVVYVNTYIKMLNKLLEARNYPQIRIGIGMATAQELVVKAGRKDIGINSKVWIGKAVTKASNLSSLGNTKLYGPIVVSTLCYDNFIEIACERDNNETTDWFHAIVDDEYERCYHADIIANSFNNWILSGMQE